MTVTDSAPMNPSLTLRGPPSLGPSLATIRRKPTQDWEHNPKAFLRTVFLTHSYHSRDACGCSPAWRPSSGPSMRRGLSWHRLNHSP